MNLKLSAVTSRDYDRIEPCPRCAEVSHRPGELDRLPLGSPHPGQVSAVTARP